MTKIFTYGVSFVLSLLLSYAAQAQWCINVNNPNAQLSRPGDIGIGVKCGDGIDAKLHVENGHFRLENPGFANGFIKFINNQNNDEWRVGYDQNSFYTSYKQTAFTSILKNGNVGIGTTNPLQKLHVAGNALINTDLTVSGLKSDKISLLQADENGKLMKSSFSMDEITQNLCAVHNTGVILQEKVASLESKENNNLKKCDDIPDNASYIHRIGMLIDNQVCATQIFQQSEAGIHQIGIKRKSPKVTLDVNGDMRIWDETPADPNNYQGSLLIQGGYNKGFKLTSHSYNKNNLWENRFSILSYNNENGDFASEKRFITMDWESGNVSIGDNMPTEYQLRVYGDVCASNIACNSDQRFKKNITPIKNALAKITALQGVNYDWKVAEFPTYEFGEQRQIGFIAQQVEKIFPEVVITDVDGYKSMAYDKLTAALVEAIKEQQKMIEQLENDNNQLKTENNTLSDMQKSMHERLTKIELLMENVAKK